MNDHFLKKHQKEPRPDFAEALYQRISEPMNTQPTYFTPRRLAAAAMAAIMLLAAIVLVSPGAQALAGNLVRQIGAIVLIDSSAVDDNAPPAPTAVPPTVAPTTYVQADAELSQAAGFTAALPTYLPDGYSAQAPWSVVRLDSGTGIYREYRDESGRHFLVFNPVKHEAGARFEQQYGENETVTDVTVRGQAGVWINGRLFGSSSEDLQPTGWLMWAEDGVTYTLYSDALSLTELMQVAEGLR